MIITYHGLSCFTFTTKSPDGQEYSLLTNPFEAKTAGRKLAKLKADVVITSNLSSPLYGDTGSVKPVKDRELFIIDHPGEYEIQNIFIQGLPGEQTNILYYLEIEKIKVAFIGTLNNTKLSPAHLELLEGSDILVIPVGGGEQINAKQASTLVNELEPRLVVPAFYKTPGIKIKGLTDTPEIFFKELGIKTIEKQDKLKITSKDLPQDELKAIWLTF